MPPRRKPLDGPPLALLYARVSTDGQVELGASLEAQEEFLLGEAARRGFRGEVIREEGVSGKNLNRPALTAALARLDAGQAQVLMAMRLDRVSRSVRDFADLLERADRRKWRLLVCDVDIDTSTPAGEFLITVMAAAARFERRIIGRRTAEGMAQKKAQGVHIGRRSELPADVRERIAGQRAAGVTLGDIADALNRDAVPTSGGRGRWYPSAVSAVLKSVEAEWVRCEILAARAGAGAKS